MLKTLFDKIINNLKMYPEHVLFEDASGVCTNADFYIQSSKVYAYLVNHGINSDDVVLIKVQRGFINRICLFGILRTGACAFIVGNWISEELYSYFIHETQPRIIIDEAVLNEINQFEPIDGYKNADLHDAAFISYTSSSMGEPKGVIQEYGLFDYIYKYLMNFNVQYPLYDYDKERGAITYPLYDVGAYATFIEQLIHNTYSYIVPLSVYREKNTFIHLLNEKQITTFVGMPHLINIHELENVKSLNSIIVSYDIIENFYSDKIPVYISYGLTEAGMPICSSEINKSYSITPVGIPDTLFNLKLMDENGNEVKSGEVGEITITAPFFRGYVNKSGLTKEVKRDNRLFTNDMGKIMPDGSLLVLGRKNDIFKTTHGYIIPSLIQKEIKRIINDDSVWSSVRAFYVDNSYRICVYYNGNITIDLYNLNNRLECYIEKYLLPTDCIKIDNIPYLTSGKLNRAELGRIFDNYNKKVK